MIKSNGRRNSTRISPLAGNTAVNWRLHRADYLVAIDSLSALAINQTAAALAKREECYRKLGLLVKAEDDHSA